MPLPDLRNILQLAQNLDGPDNALRFLTDFLSMLPGRLTRILSALTDENAKTAMDAVLGLKIRSSLNGALEAEACCLTLQASISSGNFKLACLQSKALAANVAPALLERARLELGGYAAGTGTAAAA